MISGSHDFLIPTALSAELAALIPGAEHTEFEGASHGLWLESPERLAAACKEFIERSEPKGGRP